MRAIQYAAPELLTDAVALLAQYGSRARVLAGGTDLIVQIREHHVDVDLVVDAKKIPDLTAIRFHPDDGLTIGAAVSCLQLYSHSAVRSHFPGLVDAASIIGGTAIQGRASVGGNLCNSGPAADSTPILIALGASALIAGPSGQRRVAVEAFCTAPGKNVLGPGELLVSLHLPAPAASSGSSYLRFIPRNEMDIAEVGVGAALSLDANGAVSACRIALGAVGPTPLFVPEAGAALIGQIPSEAVLESAAVAAQAAARPISDMRGTAEHRRHLVGVLTRRALRGALNRALRGQN